MTETMFARARTRRTNAGFAAIVATVVVLVAGFVAGTVSVPRPEAKELRAAAAVVAPTRG